MALNGDREPIRLQDAPLSEADGEVMRRWFAGEATEDEMADVVKRHVYAMLPDDRGCPTEGCKGDPRYAAPGRGHIEECRYTRDERTDDGAQR